VVEKAKQEKQQKVVQAEGEAAAAKLVSFLLKKILKQNFIRGRGGSFV
jgi:hypothetical protein